MRSPKPGVTLIAAEELVRPGVHTLPASTKAARRIREPEDRRGHPQLDIADGERVAAGGRDGYRVGHRAAWPSRRRRVEVLLGNDVHHRAQLVALVTAHVVRPAAVEALLRRNEVARRGGHIDGRARRWRRPAIRQLSTTSRASGRYQE